MGNIIKGYWFLIGCALIVAVVAVGYFAGYRVDEAGITRVGTMVIHNLPEGTAVYIDKSSRIFAKDGTARAQLTPGMHSVIVSATAMDPWNEVFEVVASKDTVLSPIIIPSKLPTLNITGADLNKARAAVAATKYPTKATPLILAGGCAQVYASGNRILADGTTTPSCTIPSYLACAPKSAENPTGVCATTIIRTNAQPVRALLPYPGRDDAVVVLAGNIVYALELDPRDPQFVAPVFQDQLTGIGSYATSSIVVTNGSVYEELPL